MAQHLHLVGLLSVMGLFLIPSLEASPWFWPWQSRASPSIVTISIGNRFNSNSVTDEGTSIRDLTFNLSRWKGNLTFEKNGTEILITRGNDGVTNIHIDFGSNSKSQQNETVPSNATQSRKKREIFGLPSLPAIPIPTINGTQAAIGENFFQLPNEIANPASNASNFLQPWQFLQTLITRRLPMQFLDTAVSYLSQLYSSTAKNMLGHRELTPLAETMGHPSPVSSTPLWTTSRDQTVGRNPRGSHIPFRGTFLKLAQSCVWPRCPDECCFSPIVTKAHRDGVTGIRWETSWDGNW
uniref:Putative 30.3 kDa secreted protein n=1 Tax=Aedes aegypti TaxID=7159 RepID=Q58HB5_AEDAE|nr:putative 30.3 kDa secreted protein [Aedes aegypti]